MPTSNHSTKKQPGRRQWFTRRNKNQNPQGCCNFSPSRRRDRKRKEGKAKEEEAKQVAQVKEEILEKVDKGLIQRSLERLGLGRTKEGQEE